MPSVAFNDFFTTDEATAIGPGRSVLDDNGAGADSIQGGLAQIASVNGDAGAVGNEITLASGALLTLNIDGTFDYDPNGAFDTLPGGGSGASNQSAIDSFTYSLVGGGSATVYVTIDGIDSDDFLIGTSHGDILEGGDGADTIKGGKGADSVAGGDGDDVYYVDDLFDVVSEDVQQGTDIVYASTSWAMALGAEIEQLRAYKTGLVGVILGGSDWDNYILGGAGDDSLYGAGGADRLNGGLGADFMVGGDGDDIFYVDDVLDVVVECGCAKSGDDVVLASVDWIIAADSEIEQLRASYGAATTGLTLTGNDAANYIIGGAASDTLIGSGGEDRLNGGLGADSMAGGIDGDVYYVDDAGDVVTELSGDGGTDIVIALSSWTMTAGSAIEQVRAGYGASATGLALTGNELANYLVGGAAADTLGGAAGADRLFGGLGADSMSGGADGDTYYVDDAGDAVVETAMAGGTDIVLASTSWTMTAGSEIEQLRANYGASPNGLTLVGNEGVNSILGGGADDTLDGGLGADKLVGGLGADVFLFSTTPGGANYDRIVDFDSAEGDKIALSASVFQGIGAAGGALDPAFFAANLDGLAHDVDDRLIYETDTGKLFFDADGSDPGARLLVAVLVGAPDLSAADFMIV